MQREFPQQVSDFAVMTQEAQVRLLHDGLEQVAHGQFGDAVRDAYRQSDAGRLARAAHQVGQGLA